MENSEIYMLLKQNCHKFNYKHLYNIIKQLKNYNYILLGESTHGTEEYYLIRLAITIIMVKDFGFNTILFETEWSMGYKLNLFIHSKLDEDIKHILNNFKIYPKWMYYNEYIMILLLFLKKWNETHSKKVFFYGIDCQNVELAKKNICNEKNINCKIIKDIIINYDKMKNAQNYWNIRDTFWLHIIETIKKQRSSKFILWAHNSHIGNVKANKMIGNKINIGYLLDKSYKSYKIGFSTYQGSVKASKDWDNPGRKYILKPSREDSFEYIFHLITQNMNIPSIIYNCNPSLKIDKLFRYVGVVYDSENELNAHYQLTNINKEFDIIIFIDNTNFLKQPDKSHIKMKTLTDFYKYSKKVISNIK